MKLNLLIRPQGEGPRSKSMVFDMFCISRSKAGCKKKCIKKIVFLAKVMNFFKYGSQYYYFTCALHTVQASNCNISKQLEKHFLQKPCMVETRGPELCS